MRILRFVPILAAALAVASVAQASARAGGYSLELVDEAGNRLRTFENGGRTYVLGVQGTRYSLRLHNNTNQRVEFVAAVDGRDVLDGQPSGWDKRGYIVNPYGDVVIDGFRLTSESVAAFRFSSVDQSYASRMGDARDVGVIGVAVFPELQRYIPPPPPPDYGFFHGQRGLDDGARDSAAPSAMSGAEAGGAGYGGSGKRMKSARQGLGTEFGEQRESRVYETEFQRSSAQPAAVLTVRYDDRRGLTAMGIDLRPDYSRQYEARLRETASPFRRDPGFSEPPPGWNAY